MCNSRFIVLFIPWFWYSALIHSTVSLYLLLGANTIYMFNLIEALMWKQWGSMQCESLWEWEVCICFPRRSTGKFNMNHEINIMAGLDMLISWRRILRREIAWPELDISLFQFKSVSSITCFMALGVPSIAASITVYYLRLVFYAGCFFDPMNYVVASFG